MKLTRKQFMKLSAATAVAASAGSLTACSGSSETFTMIIGHVMSDGHPRTTSLAQFAEDVAEKTDGRVTVDVKGDGVLGSEKEILEQLLGGQVQAMRGGQMDYTSRLYAFSLPFLANNGDEISAVLSSDIALEIAQDSADVSGHIIINTCNAGGFRNFSNNVRPVAVPADIAGLKMRAPSIDTIVWTLETLGANVTSVDYNELYQALATGVCDGQENPWSNVATMKFYEQQKYFSEVRYQFHPDALGINKDWWESLGTELQDILKECATDMGILNDELCDELDAEYKQIAVDYGCEVYVPTDAEIDEWTAACAPVYDLVVENGLASQDEIDQMVAIVAACRV
ncbi:MAG: TRAP transporter substrate-binding protein [Faecalibacterium sp.]